MIRNIISILNGILIGTSIFSYVQTGINKFAMIALLVFCVTWLHLMGDD